MHDWAERELEHVRRVRKDGHLTPTAGALFECGAERDRLREVLKSILTAFHLDSDGTARYFVVDPIIPLPTIIPDISTLPVTERMQTVLTAAREALDEPVPGEGE